MTQKTKQGRDSRGVWMVVILILVVVAEAIWLPRFLGTHFLSLLISVVIYLATIALFLFLMAWTYLAPKNRGCTFVDEGTGKPIMKGAANVGFVMQRKGYTLDPDWNVVPENTWVKDGKVVAKGTSGAKMYKEPRHLLGGFRVFGLPPIYDIYVYKFGWVGINYKGEIDVHPKEWIDYIYLKDDQYLCDVKEAETKPPENLPIDIDAALTLRIVNPHKALFTVDNWLEITLNKFRAIIVDYVRQYTWNQLLKKEKRIGDEIMELAKEKGVIDEMFGYGVLIIKVDLQRLDPTKEPSTPLRKAVLQRFLAIQKKKATVIEAEAESIKRGKETLGALIKMIANATGLKPKEVKEKINTSPKLYQRIQKLSEDLIVRQVTPNLLDIRTTGSKGLEKTLLNIVAALQSLPLKKPSQKTKKTKKRSTRQSKS